MIRTAVYLSMALVLFPGCVRAQDSSKNGNGGGDVDKRLSELEREVKELREKVKQQDEKPREQPPQDRSEHPIRFFGYGEVHLNNPRTGATAAGQTNRSQAELHRFVIGLGYDFNEQISLTAEFDLEHSFRTPEVEFVHLDIKLSKACTFRSGVLLMPVGSMNEFHEPPVFASVERPQVDTLVIPTTWQESGLGFLGDLSTDEVIIKYRAYLVSGMDPSDFKASNGIRDGRGRGLDTNSFSDGMAGVGRIEVQPVSWLQLGGSVYRGQAEKREAPKGDTDVRIFEIDGRFDYQGFYLKGEAALVEIPDADEITPLVPAADRPVGEEIEGWYLEAGYDVLQLLLAETDCQLVVFGRREFINTQAEVPDGFVKQNGMTRRIWTFGAAFYPIPSVAFKVDHEDWEDNAHRDLKRWNFGIAFEYHP